MRYLALYALAALLLTCSCRRYNDYYCACYRHTDTLDVKTILGKTSDMTAQYADTMCSRLKPADSCAVWVALSPAE